MNAMSHSLQIVKPIYTHIFPNKNKERVGILINNFTAMMTL
jgi:hypothetical protein